MNRDKADNLAAASSANSLSEAKLPPPTNANPRNISHSVSSVDEHLQSGEAELNLGHFVEARTHFESVLKEQPQHGKANHRMGVLCDKLGDYASAERYYRLAILQDPEDAAILSDLGYSYWLQGRYDESESVLMQARQLDPQYKNAIANLGMVYGTTGREQEALAMFRQIGDEATAQDFMKQVAALASNSNTSPTTGGPMSPIVQTGHEITSSRETSRVDLENVNEPTREILELMEEGRRQQELAEQARDRERAARTAAAQQRQTPPFVKNRLNSQHGYVPQMAGVDPFGAQPYNHPNKPQDQPRVPDAYLSEALARIDRSDRRTPPSGPITLGPNSNSQPNTAPQASPNLSSSPTQITSSGVPQSSPQQGPHYASQPPQTPMREQGQPAVTPYGYLPATPNGSFTSQPMATTQAAQPQQMPPTVASMSEQSPETQPSQQEMSPAVITYGTPKRNPGYSRPPQTQPQMMSTPPMNPPVNMGVRQASGFTQSSDGPGAIGQHDLGQQPVEHAYHQQQQGAQPSIDLLSAANNPNATPPNPAETTAVQPQTSPAPQTPGSQWPLVPAATTDPNDPYQQARRQAAIMGLGAGPEQLFPYVQQTQRAVPGSSSMWNGAQYPPPQRQLPTNRNPADLSPSFASPQATNLTPGPNYQGHLLPPVAAPVNTATQFGAPASVSHQQFQQPTYEVPPATTYTQTYENIRQQSNQQLSQLIDQTYGQSVQTPPSGVAALPSQTYHAPQTEQLSQYNTPQTGRSGQATNVPGPQLTPPQFSVPTSPVTQIQQYGTPETDTPHQPTHSSASQGIVIPEQYRPATNSSYQPSRTSQQPTSTSAPSHRVNTMPVIVPGER